MDSSREIISSFRVPVLKVEKQLHEITFQYVSMDPKHNQAVDETNMSIEQSMPRHPLTGEGTMWLTAERCSENEAILSSSMYKDYILI